MSFTKDTLKALIATIKKNSTANDGSENELAEALVTLENEGDDTLTKLSVATTEAITRKKKLKALESENEDQKIEIESLTEAQSNDTTKAELEALKKFKTNTVNGQRKDFGSGINGITKHANFAKAKDLFKLPEPDKDGVYDVEKISDEDLTYNIDKMAELNGLDYFGSNGAGKVEVDGKKVDVVPDGLKDRIAAAIESKDPEELQKIQDEQN